MNEEQYQLETTEHLIDALEGARIVAGARFEQECKNKSYVDAVFFESIRDRLASEIKTVKDYKRIRKERQDESIEPKGRDTVSKEAVLRELDKADKEGELGALWVAIQQLPNVVPAAGHGVWLDCAGASKCSVCGFCVDDQYYLGFGRACPNCGVPMDPPYCKYQKEDENAE